MSAPDPRLADALLLRLAALRAQHRKASTTDPARSLPPGWWRDFLRVCVRELPEHGVSILLDLGMDATELQTLEALSDADFEAALAATEED